VFRYRVLRFRPGCIFSFTSNATVSRFTGFDLSLSEKATRFRSSLRKNSEIAGNGYLKVSYSSAGLATPLLYSIDQLRYRLAIKNPQDGMKSFVFDAGRFSLSDPSSYVLSSPADGCSFSFSYPSVLVSFRSAYTGLLFS
jgi:hypothetical protein